MSPVLLRFGAAACALFFVQACGGAAQPPEPPPESTPIPPGPDWKAPSTKKAPDTPASKFARLRDKILDQWMEDDPSLGRQLGLHAWDGKVGQFDASALAARYARIKKAREELGAVDKTKLSADDQLDLAILLSQADLFLFKGVDLKDSQKRPQFYEDLFSVNGYLDRDYAPITERGKRLVAHEKAALEQTPNVLKNLQGPMSKPVLETAIKIYRGYAEYLRGDAVKQLKGVGDAAFQSDFAKTNEELAKQAIAIADQLEKVELPKGDQSHVLGVERYKKLLLVQEGLSIPLAEFKRMGEANLAVNKTAFEQLSQKVKLVRPKATELLGSATKLMDASRAFVVSKAIATIPTDEKAVLKETPPFMRWNSAFLDPPGPFEQRGQLAFYYITMPDPKWSQKEQDEYVMPMGILLSTTVHEVYPGHFLQGQWIQKAPTKVQKTLAAYSFVEGWAHYGEQVMIEEGFGADDPQNKLGQLSDALLRNCRFVVSLGVHAEGMSLQQAEQRFMNDCKQDKATAREQAVRATFDPGYFAYTLGKIQILGLRDEAKKKMGAKFTLKAFHDALLSHGSPPVPLIHDRVLKDLEAQAK